MKFDVIIGNPPYQLSSGVEGRNNARATAIYNLFIDKAIELNPKYITMIIPSRWMTKTASGVTDDWVNKIINSNKMKEIHDYQNSSLIFNNVSIRGGVNYFLWQKSYNGKCTFYQKISPSTYNKRIGYLNEKNIGIIIRDVKAYEILDKVIKVEKDNLGENSEKNFSSMVSPGKFFSSTTLQSNWKGFKNKQDEKYNIKYHVSSFTSKDKEGWIREADVLKNKETVGLHKVYINSVGYGEKFGPILNKPFYGEPNSSCSETYLVIGYDHKKHNFTKNECFNIMSYIKTKFFRFMAYIKISSQNCTRHVYQFVPLQDFSKPWTDEELYKKYKLTQEEIDYIEDNIDEME